MRGEKSPKNETTVSCAFRLRRVILYSMTAAFYLLAMVFFYKAYDVKINCAKSIYAISAAMQVFTIGLSTGVILRAMP